MQQTGIRILLVEDHDDTRTLAAIALGKNGFHVVTAATKADALAASRSEQFDVLLGDVQLSDGSGLDLMRELAAVSNIKGIAYTARGFPADVAATRLAGYQIHLTKPADLETVIEAVRRVVGQPDDQKAGQPGGPGMSRDHPAGRPAVEAMKVAAWCPTFGRLFDTTDAQVALLNLAGDIVATNASWRRFGSENGLPASYDCVGQNYLQICFADREDPFGPQAHAGLADVLQARRSSFTLTYPCHSPSAWRWYRMCVERQTPHLPAVLVSHFLCGFRKRTEPPSANTAGKNTPSALPPE